MAPSPALTQCLSSNSSSYAFESMGLRIGVQSEDSKIIEQIRQRAIPIWRECESTNLDLEYTLLSSEDTYLIKRNDEVLGRCRKYDDLMDEFDRWVHIDIGANSKNFVFIHAGAVVWQGSGLILPGKSMAGKTTLVKTLIGLGADFYSDEFAVIDKHGQLHSYPRDLGSREPDGSQNNIPALELGWKSSMPDVDIKLVASITYNPKLKSEFRQCSRGLGILSLLNNAVGARTQPENTVNHIEQLAKHADFIEGERGDALQTAKQLIDILGSRKS